MKQRNKQKRLGARVTDHALFMAKKDSDLQVGVAKRRAGGGYHQPRSNNK